ncbi:MAG: DUF3047 domain-containing protein [Gemmatimonadales bacterium]
MIALALLLLLGQAGAPLDILRLAEAAPGAGVPPGWKVRPVRGQIVPDTEIRGEGDGPVFRVTGAGRAAWFYRELSPRLPEAAGSLHWSWRVLEAPAGTDLRAKQTDDSPIRVYVVFGKPGGLFGGSGRIIFYTYGNSEPPDYSGASLVGDKLHVIRVDGAAERGVWQEHGVEPFADYRRIWHRNPPPITAIGVMQDTDQTRAMAAAELRRLEWRKP